MFTFRKNKYIIYTYYNFCLFKDYILKGKIMGKYCEKFKNGNLVEMLLLNILSKGDSYGYEIIQFFNTVSDSTITLATGNLYPMLYRLEENGLITNYKKLVGKRMERVYYHLTEEGYKELQEMTADYEKMISITDRMLKYEYFSNSKTV